MNASLADYLAAGPLLVARVKDQVAGLRHVLPATELSAMKETGLPSPSAFVIYDGDRLGDSALRGQSRVVYQRWLVVLAVRNATQGDGGQAIQDEAGPLLSSILGALQGHILSPDHRPLIRVQAPKPGYSAAFAYYPLAFETGIQSAAI